MSASYQVIDRESTNDSATGRSHRELAAFLAKDGQFLLPLVELIEQAQCAVDEVIDVMGRATIEAVLRLSAEQVAGPRQQGKRTPKRDVDEMTAPAERCQKFSGKPAGRGPDKRTNGEKWRSRAASALVHSNIRTSAGALVRLHPRPGRTLFSHEWRVAVHARR